MRLMVMVLAAAICPLSASVLTIDAVQFTPGASSQVIGPLIWKASGGTFQAKIVAGYTGLGISGGATGDEIDIGEVLTAEITTGGLPFRVPSLTLGVLFDGPEFGDVQEVAKVTITSLSHGTLSYTLTNSYEVIPPGPDLAIWSGLGTVTNLSPSTGSDAAVWRITSPFGAIDDITRIQFTALAGICGNGACTNQSDFTLNQVQIEQVPEIRPAAMFALGLSMLGLLLFLRRKSQRPILR